MKPFFQQFTAEIQATGKYTNNQIDSIIEAICQKLNLTIVGSATHAFEPQGYTSIRILSESHIAIHYWPENDFIHMDLICCQKDLTQHEVIQALTDSLPGTTISCKLI